MKASTILPIIIGGIVTLVALNRGLFSKKEPARPKYLVAMAALPANEAIRAQYIGTKEWTESGPLPEAYIPQEQQVRYHGRYVRSPIKKGQAITEDKLWPLGVTSVMMAKLQSDPTMRGIPVKVDAVTGGAGFVNPGDRVDVMAIGNLLDGSGIKAKIILQGVEVLAVNRRASRPTGPATEEKGRGRKKSRGPEKLTHVTLLLSLTQAEKLKAIESQRGVKLQFVLAGRDAKRVDTPGATVRDALGMGPPPSPPATESKGPSPTAAEPNPPSRKHKVEIRRGAEEETLLFDVDDGE